MNNIDLYRVYENCDYPAESTIYLWSGRWTAKSLIVTTSDPDEYLGYKTRRWIIPRAKAEKSIADDGWIWAGDKCLYTQEKLDQKVSEREAQNSEYEAKQRQINDAYAEASKSEKARVKAFSQKLKNVHMSESNLYNFMRYLETSSGHIIDVRKYRSIDD